MYLGIDVGSISTNLAVLDKNREIIKTVYILTKGDPINAIKQGLKQLECIGDIKGVATTGSGRKLAGTIVGADLIKNEITTHALASLDYKPDTKTVIEIGGQDSKIIIIRNGIVVDFAMNTLCAAGTGSFLDYQATRLGLSIHEFSQLALKSTNPVTIAGRCTVFAESDMIHKAQVGYKIEDIIAGLCEALVRNYLNNVAKGKDIQNPIMFQGGVAANLGIKKAFEKALNTDIIVPPYHNVMGAIGAALLLLEDEPKTTNFKGFEIIDANYTTSSFECKDCPNHCEIIEINQNNQLIGRWGSRCKKWDY